MRVWIMSCSTDVCIAKATPIRSLLSIALDNKSQVFITYLLICENYLSFLLIWLWPEQLAIIGLSNNPIHRPSSYMNREWCCDWIPENICEIQFICVLLVATLMYGIIHTISFFMYIYRTFHKWNLFGGCKYWYSLTWLEFISLRCLSVFPALSEFAVMWRRAG